MERIIINLWKGNCEDLFPLIHGMGGTSAPVCLGSLQYKIDFNSRKCVSDRVERISLSLEGRPTY